MLHRWLTDRAAGVRRLRLVPKHAAPTGRLAPLWASLSRSLERLELHLERELPLTSEQVSLSAPQNRVKPILLVPWKQFHSIFNFVTHY